mmetsp:Transcript_5955/g.8784  ORF Transcript_5955/g.8784 Transcript_5955/m.8784 type:complete len:425 (+) Transcript_5955:156-1430(+)
MHESALVITTYQALTWNLYLMPALLFRERYTEESEMRKCFLQTRVLAVLIEMFFFTESVLSFRLAGLCMAGVSLFSLLASASGFGLISRNFLVPCTVCARLCQIPAIHIANTYALTHKTSKWKFKALAWIMAEILATAALLPGLNRLLTQPITAFIICGLPPFILAVLLFQKGKTDSSFLINGKTKKDKNNIEKTRLSLKITALYTLIACCLGTCGEALNDMIIDLKVRNALKAGNSSLAMAYNLAVIFAMSAAYLVESRADDLKKARHRQLFVLFWFATQVFRSFAMPIIHSGATIVLACTVLLDKFAGPLGGAALDASLLELLHSSTTTSISSSEKKSFDNKSSTSSMRRYGLQVGGLWALRSGFEKVERPVIQLFLLSQGAQETPLWLPPLFSAGTATAVVLILEFYGQQVEHTHDTKKVV